MKYSGQEIAKASGKKFYPLTYWMLVSSSAVRFNIDMLFSGSLMARWCQEMKPYVLVPNNDFTKS